VEAGRYVARRVYIGARQSTNGVSQGLLQVDLTRRLKLTAAIGNGSTTAQGVTPENDPGDSVGLTYQFEY
jgi:translocation and assembly module TamB